MAGPQSARALLDKMRGGSVALFENGDVEVGRGSGWQPAAGPVFGDGIAGGSGDGSDSVSERDPGDGCFSSEWSSTSSVIGSQASSDIDMSDDGAGRSGRAGWGCVSGV